MAMMVLDARLMVVQIACRAEDVWVCAVVLRREVLCILVKAVESRLEFSAC